MIDTACFTLLGLYGILQNPMQIFVVSYLVKVASIFISGTTVSLCKKWIKINE